MIKRIVLLGIVIMLAIPVYAITKSNNKLDKDLKAIKRVPDNFMDSKTPYTGVTGSYFDKSANGYGWGGYVTRKVAYDMSGITAEPMIGSMYRQLNDAGTGTIGAVLGEYTTDTFNNVPNTVMAVSPHGYAAPGGRYPTASGFINGYYFGVFNDYNYADISGDTADSHAMFAVADATFGYTFPAWYTGDLVAENGAEIPGGWSGNGEVVYDQASGYYYWTTVWDQWEGNPATVKANSIVVGRTLTPTDISSWEWSDYSETTFDLINNTPMTEIYDMQVAYCKDVYGNGTGSGVVVCVGHDSDNTVYVDSAYVDLHERIYYMYTNDWGGADDGSGFKSNWIMDGEKMFKVDPKNLFDWYGSEIVEIDTTTNDTVITVMNDPQICWTVASVGTEKNNIHLLLKVFGGTVGDTGWYYFNDEDLTMGYYHVKGTVTDTGVNWSKATYIATPVGLLDEDGIGAEIGLDFQYTNSHGMSIGNTGDGTIYATWLDRPVKREQPNPHADASTAPGNYFMQDAYMSFSGDEGNTWEIPTEEEEPNYGHIEVWFEPDSTNIYNFYYATNVTKTPYLHEDGWSVASNGFGNPDNDDFVVYGVNQYYDSVNPIQAEPTDLAEYQQFFNVWKLTGTITSGLNAENVTLDMNYELMQNYPNPFNPTTEISFNMMNDANVKLSVFNVKGEMVSELVNGPLSKGFHKVSFDASAMNSGVYFYQLDANGFKTTKKMVLAK